MAAQLKDIQLALYSLKNDQKAEDLSRFFKTSPGCYGEHDRFLGITVPKIRKISKQFADLAFIDLHSLLLSPYNEERLAALLILRFQYEKATSIEKQTCVDFYLAHVDSINNWNLVDLSAPYILGDWTTQTSAAPLFQLVESPQMWHRRIAMIASHAFIKQHQYDVPVKLAEKLLKDPHELIHKATGWMLREIGKRDIQTLYDFLDAYSPIMPRTMLRYALEKVEPEMKTYYMQKESKTSKRHSSRTSL